VGDDYFEIAVEHGFGLSPRGLRAYLNRLFGNVAITGRRVLDVGAGNGLLGFYCLRRGATTATAIEPEAAGAAAGVEKSFGVLADLLGVGDRATISTATFQEFQAPAESFDLVLLHNSINHLNEDATITLLKSDESRDRYREVFRKLVTLCRPGADVVVTDASGRTSSGISMSPIRSPAASTGTSTNARQHGSSCSRNRGSATCGCGGARWDVSVGSARLRWPIRWGAYFLHSQFVLQCRRPVTR
jgi:SAM-dependent methyltransferase